MQFADLMKLFREGQNEGRKKGYVTQGACDAEGVTAIVRALRDEFREEYGMWERFTKILGSDAAPAPQANTVELSQAFVSQIEQSRTEAHRNAAPAVCVWERDREACQMVSACQLRTDCSPYFFIPKGPCPQCERPIKFTEANHG